jgi:hypothetical protein
MNTVTVVSVISSNYLINGTQIPVHSSYVDLGVIINDDLSFRDHINSIVSKARQRTSVLLRGFVSRRLDIMRTTFVTYVRPLLEYNSVVWNPSQKQFIDLIENVQRSFTKRIPSLSPLSYHERLAFLNLEPLKLCRLRFDLTYYYKVLHNLIPLLRLMMSLLFIHPWTHPDHAHHICVNQLKHLTYCYHLSFAGMLLRGTPCHPVFVILLLLFPLNIFSNSLT